MIEWIFVIALTFFLVDIVMFNGDTFVRNMYRSLSAWIDR